jgi:small subunit ribosomal protein S2
MIKKEGLKVKRELVKLDRNLGGIRNLEKLPDAVFILDTKKEDIAVTEANKLGLPIVAVVDTNCDPDVIQYVIPGNDDAIRSGALMARVICEAVEEGRLIRSKRLGYEAPRPRTPEEEAEKNREQAEARRQASLAAAEREARVAAAKAAPAADAGDEAPDAAPTAEGEPAVADPAVTEAAVQAAAPEAATEASEAPASE